MNIIEISDSSYSMSSFDDGGNEFMGPQDGKDIEEPVEEERRVNPIRLDIREVGHGFSFLGVCVVTQKN